MGDKIVLDLETQKSFDEVGGFDQTEKLGISVCSIYSYDQDEYITYKEDQLKELGKTIKDASLIIGFNSKKFDFTVLQPYLKFNLNKLPHLDILEEIYHALGHRLKLNSVAMTTLGEGKIASGLDAIWYYKNKDWGNLIKYCEADVKITKEVYEYGKNHGHLWYDKSGQRTTIPVRWKGDQTVRDLLDKAYKNGYQLEIDYLPGNGDERGLRKIDIKNINGSRVQAFCHLNQTVRFFNIPQILSAKKSGAQQDFQYSMF